MQLCVHLRWYMKPHYLRTKQKSNHQLPITKFDENFLLWEITLLAHRTSFLPVMMNLQENRTLLHHFRLPLYLRLGGG